MSWRRLVNRNGLQGDYVSPGQTPGTWIPAIAGDMRRLEKDTRDDVQVAHAAARTGVPPEQVKKVLDDFFSMVADR